MRSGSSQSTAPESGAEAAPAEAAPAAALPIVASTGSSHELRDVASERSSLGSRIVLALLLLVATSGLAWLLTRDRDGARAAANEAAVIQVRAAVAERRDVPMWLDGIGSVRAFNTVTVTSRVTGELESVEFSEGQEVQAGDVLARIDARQFEIARDQAAAKLAQDQAQLANARAELQASQTLASGAYESKLTLAMHAARVDEMKALVAADRAAVRATKLQLEYTTIVAPIAGRTGLRRVGPGNIVRSDDVEGLVTIAQLVPIAVVFSVPQERLPEVLSSIRGDARPLVHVMSSAGTVIAEGELLLVDNQIDATTGTASLKATFANTDHRLWPAQFVGARVRIGMRGDAVVVPSQAVQPGADGPLVYVIAEGEIAEARNVVTGPSGDGVTVVEKGVEPGERVVVEGQFKLSTGSLVQVQDDAT